MPVALAVESATLPPVQKLVGPWAVIVGAAPAFTLTVIALEVAEQPLLVTVRV